MKQVRIGLLGVGTVGQAVARALVERQDVLSRAAGTPLLLQRAAVRDLARPRGLPADRLTSDPAAVAAADDVDLVIELVGGEEPARSLITTALERGRPVVTANKRVLAWHGPQLAELAARRGVELRYEAAVGGGIPLIAPLTDDLAANRVLELRAIINGTCNYVLTRMASGESLEDALAKAQQAGYAEADPRDDVDAVDAGDKLVVLLRLAFDVECTPAQLHRQGIRGLDPRDLAYGRELGYVLKLLAVARSTESGVEARVHPAFLPSEHPLARVDGAYNAVHVIGDLCGPVMFSGLGAGGDATASAVLADVVHVARRLALGDPVPPPRQNGRRPRLLPMAEVTTRCYFRLSVDDEPGVFAQITRVLADHHIGLASVIQREPGRHGSAEVVLLTYAAPEAALADAEEQLAKLPSTQSVRARIRVEAPK
ncbi:MAG: homoserine dehydrogenase [Deltaproteobacteria bacterium]|nr:MAG: homoserine dehydrogenase [Deltaproteobacteria bacterium]